MDPFSAQVFHAILGTKSLGLTAIFLDTVDSTSTEARRRLSDGLPHGTVFLADRQTGGRGRRGRHWVSEPGCGLWMSVVLEPFMAMEEMQKLTLLIGLAVCRAVESMTDRAVKPTIKWPNDVLAAGKKLCGILCESAVDGLGRRMVIAGIGVNTRTPSAGYGEATAVATSIGEVAGRPAGRLALAAEILGQMEALLGIWQAEGFASVAAGYREFMLPAGTAVAIVDGNERRLGRVESLNDEGALLVRLEGGRLESVISGEISIRGVDGYA